MQVNGWTLYAHPLFLDQLEKLTAVVEKARDKDPEGYRSTANAKLLAALNTGHEGGCGTVHANSAADVPARLEALAALGGLPRAALHAQAAAALDVLVHITRLPDGRRWVQELSLLQWDEAAALCRPVPGWEFPPCGDPVQHPGAAELAKALRWPR